jgi:hypothetical protein
MAMNKLLLALSVLLAGAAPIPDIADARRGEGATERRIVVV